jgi:hypothetical protein
MGGGRRIHLRPGASQFLFPARVLPKPGRTGRFNSVGLPG